ncbi:mitochondrial adenyl nucleotide antiporter SLC25A24-like [Convolutriloba macropyga]|uniref:mitochondrial adenyl nucleotide antiporter SLC25A24-like n=1 Tax=Convolutriloba macropyga TaxID=536237 RepID=UPI003F52610D
MREDTPNVIGHARRTELELDQLVDTSQAPRAIKHLVAGVVAAAVSKTATAPVDRCSKLQQANTRKFVTMRQAWASMAREGTLWSYFRGNAANVLKCAPELGIKLALNDQLKLRVPEDPSSIQLHERLACGGMAGVVSQASTYPLEVIRTRLALTPSRSYGMLRLIAKVRRQEGCWGFWKGLGCASVGVFPYAGLDICVFESLKLWLLGLHDGQPPPKWTVFGAGVTSSVVAQLPCYPLALVLTRLQMEGAEGRRARYSGVVDAIRKTVRREGWAGLYKGCLPNTLRIAPAAGISWMVYDHVVQILAA